MCNVRSFRKTETAHKNYPLPSTHQLILGLIFIYGFLLLVLLPILTKQEQLSSWHTSIFKSHKNIPILNFNWVGRNIAGIPVEVFSCFQRKSFFVEGTCHLRLFAYRSNHSS